MPMIAPARRVATQPPDTLIEIALGGATMRMRGAVDAQHSNCAP